MTELNCQSVHTRKSRKKGFTLTEIAIVLGIIGLILGAIWVAAAAVYNNQRVSHANSAVLQIAQGVRMLFAGSNSTGESSATDITSNLITANAVPSDLVSGTTLAGPFPGGHTVVSSTGDGEGFTIGMNNLSQSNCVNLISAVGGTSRDPGLYEAEGFSSNTAPSAGDASATVGTPMTIAGTPLKAEETAANGFGGCTGSSSGLYEVVFGFTLK